MELALNLGWVVLAMLMCWFWLRHPALRERAPRQTQFVALALVLAAMFIVITLYDDMAMAQTAAETSGVQREDSSSGVNAQAMQHLVATLTHLPVLELRLQTSHLGALAHHPAPTPRSPAVASIQNRPPPAV